MRAVLRFLFSALGILAASSVVPGIHAGRFVDLLAVAVILGFFNATLGQFLKAVAFVPVACTFGCLNLVDRGFLRRILYIQANGCLKMFHDYSRFDFPVIRSISIRTMQTRFP